MLRKMTLVAVAAMALTGCGKAYGPVAVTPAGLLQAQGASRFVEVLKTEDALWETLDAAANHRLAAAPFQVPTGEHGELERATGLRFEWLAVRATAKGREVVGQATISGVPDPGSFLPHQVHRPVKLTLDAAGQATALDPDFQGLAGTPVERLKLVATDAGTATKVTADLKAFLNAPAQAALVKLPMWRAIAGRDARSTVELKAFTATRGAHGAFGRVFGLEVDMRVNGKLVLEGMPVLVVTDKAGKVAAIH